MNAMFWSGKRVFLTGHSGFKGGWLSLWLEKMGAEVFGYALSPPSKPSLFSEAAINKHTCSLKGDIRDLEQLRASMADCRPDIVFHLAAQAIVRNSYNDPVYTFDTNVMGTVNLLEAIRAVDSVRAVVVVTSDKCYENRECCWGYRENEAMGGYDPYSCSKGCAELVTSAYRRSFFGSVSERAVMIASVRAGNVIGGGDWADDRLIPDIMRSLMAGKPVVIRNPTAVRPWQHVLEPLRGYLMLAERLWNEEESFADAWNFGPDTHSTRPVRWIVDQLTRLWGKGACWEQDPDEHPHEAHYLKLDCSKAETLLGWKPLIDLPLALEWVAAWYHKFQQGADMFSETCLQIDDYMQLIKP